MYVVSDASEGRTLNSKRKPLPTNSSRKKRRKLDQIEIKDSKTNLFALIILSSIQHFIFYQFSRTNRMVLQN